MEVERSTISLKPSASRVAVVKRDVCGSRCCRGGPAMLGAWKRREDEEIGSAEVCVLRYCSPDVANASAPAGRKAEMKFAAVMMPLQDGVFCLS